LVDSHDVPCAAGYGHPQPVEKNRVRSNRDFSSVPSELWLKHALKKANLTFGEVRSARLGDLLENNAY
jgi:hypothetical protein